MAFEFNLLTPAQPANETLLLFLAGGTVSVSEFSLLSAIQL